MKSEPVQVGLGHGEGDGDGDGGGVIFENRLKFALNYASTNAEIILLLSTNWDRHLETMENHVNISNVERREF